MKKTTLVGAAALLAAVAMISGCKSDGAVAESSGTKASCADKTACCSDKSAEAKAGATCTGEAKATEAKAGGCCADKAAGAAQVK